MVDFDSVLFCIWGWRHEICFSSLGLLWYRILGIEVIIENSEVDGQYTPKLLKLLRKSPLTTSAVWCDRSCADRKRSPHLGHSMAILNFPMSSTTKLWGPKERVLRIGSPSLAQGHNRYLQDITWLNGWNSIIGFTHSNSAICLRNISPETVWDGLLVYWLKLNFWYKSKCSEQWSLVWKMLISTLERWREGRRSVVK